MLAQRPHRSLPDQEQMIEVLIRAMLGQPILSKEANNCWHALKQTIPDFSPWQAGKHYQPFLPVPLWGTMYSENTTHSTRSNVSTNHTGTSEDVHTPRQKRTAHRHKQDQSMRDDPLVLNRFEKLLSWSEMVNVNRPVEDDEEQAAKSAAQAIENFTLSPHEQHAATQLKFDLDLSPDDVNPHALIGELTYPEWNFKRKQYHPRQCRVIFQHTQPSCASWTPDPQTLKRLRKIRRQFEALLPKREMLRHQYEGDELDMDALVRSRCDFLATGNHSESVYCNTRQQTRDLSVAILIDVSLSTDSWIDGRRILDIEKEALIDMVK